MNVEYFFRNTTVDCDQATANLAALGVDYNCKRFVIVFVFVETDSSFKDWYQENLTALCTPSCSASLNSWLAKVESACASDEINQSGILVQAKIVPLQYTYYYSVACLQDSYANFQKH